MDNIINLMEFRNTYGWGGGPDKTIIMSARDHNKNILSVHPVYLRGKDDNFELTKIAEQHGVSLYEIIENSALDFQSLMKCVKYAKEHKVDIIHGHDYKTNLFALIIKLFFLPKVKIVTTLHGWVPIGLKMKIYTALDKFCILFFDRIFLLYPRQIEHFPIKPPKSVLEIIPNGIVDTDWKKDSSVKAYLHNELNLHTDNIIIGSVGRIMPEKDIITTLRVFKKLTTQFNVVLVFIGTCKDQSYMNSLQLEIKLSGLTEKVFFLGKRTDIKSIYSSLDLFLLTSITEGFPNTLLESFAMEVPSVVSAVGGIPEIVSNGEHAILCKPGDINSFYNACKAILTDMELRIKLINNGKKIIQEKLSFKKRLKLLEKVYCQMINCQIKKDS